MTKRALSLVGVAMMSVACGTGPTAVEIPGVSGPSGEGVASTTARGIGPKSAPTCEVTSVEIKVLGYESNRSDGRKAALLRAGYVTSGAKGSNSSNCGAPVWAVDNNESIVVSALNRFEATLVADGGKHIVTATAPNAAHGSVLVQLQ